MIIKELTMLLMFTQQEKYPLLSWNVFTLMYYDYPVFIKNVENVF